MLLLIAYLGIHGIIVISELPKCNSWLRNCDFYVSFMYSYFESNFFLSKLPVFNLWKEDLQVDSPNKFWPTGKFFFQKLKSSRWRSVNVATSVRYLLLNFQKQTLANVVIFQRRYPPLFCLQRDEMTAFFFFSLSVCEPLSWNEFWPRYAMRVHQFSWIK